MMANQTYRVNCRICQQKREALLTSSLGQLDLNKKLAKLNDEEEMKALGIELQMLKHFEAAKQLKGAEIRLRETERIRNELQAKIDLE